MSVQQVPPGLTGGTRLAGTPSTIDTSSGFRAVSFCKQVCVCGQFRTCILLVYLLFQDMFSEFIRDMNTQSSETTLWEALPSRAVYAALSNCVQFFYLLSSQPACAAACPSCLSLLLVCLAPESLRGTYREAAVWAPLSLSAHSLPPTASLEPVLVLSPLPATSH